MDVRDLETREYRLEPMKFGIERSIPNIEVELNRDAVRNAVNVMVESIIPRQEFRPERVVRYPASWWQGLKEVLFPKWLQRRFPVRYTEVELHGQAFYPQLALSPHEAVVQVTALTRSEVEVMPGEKGPLVRRLAPAPGLSEKDMDQIRNLNFRSYDLPLFAVSSANSALQDAYWMGVKDCMR